jgi:hypothetical protein
MRTGVFSLPMSRKGERGPRRDDAERHNIFDQPTRKGRSGACRRFEIVGPESAPVVAVLGGILGDAAISRRTNVIRRPAGGTRSSGQAGAINTNAIPRTGNRLSRRRPA